MFQSNVRKRLAVNKAMTLVIIACAATAITPLLWILGTLFVGGAGALSWEFLTAEPGAVGTGVPLAIGPAIQGTLIIIGLSGILGIPVGVMAGVYLAEIGRGRLAAQVRFFMDVFMQVPSIVLGIFAFLAIVLLVGGFSLWAGAFALSLIMFPIVARSTEGAMRMVPWSLREAGTALGLRGWVVTLRVVLPAAKRGIITGVLLSVSRVGGETAPLIMTILGSSQFFAGLSDPMDALPLRIWRLSLQPYDEARLAGWGAALVLVLVILAIHVGVRYWFVHRGKGLIASPGRAGA
ncbi:ABC-type phosphate transport system, permease component [Cenarchaeum symbiosum A]|uniref:Phosphate transport system permease protein PstA n=1 Tax=Cenarchaeum symbiosum (strain A) TaxID=414004 RepID=A0RV43_CENSY|nr:ABC-type phosphate transport system, permease component [Cenarchaeum symbiosum A]